MHYKPYIQNNKAKTFFPVENLTQYAEMLKREKSSTTVFLHKLFTDETHSNEITEEIAKYLKNPTNAIPPLFHLEGPLLTFPNPETLEELQKCTTQKEIAEAIKTGKIQLISWLVPKELLNTENGKMLSEILKEPLIYDGTNILTQKTINNNYEPQTLDPKVKEKFLAQCERNSQNKKQILGLYGEKIPLESSKVINGIFNLDALDLQLLKNLSKQLPKNASINIFSHSDNRGLYFKYDTQNEKEMLAKGKISLTEVIEVLESGKSIVSHIEEKCEKLNIELFEISKQNAEDVMRCLSQERQKSKLNPANLGEEDTLSMLGTEGKGNTAKQHKEKGVEQTNGKICFQ